jgi:hypothetical protein
VFFLSARMILLECHESPAQNHRCVPHSITSDAAVLTFSAMCRLHMSTYFEKHKLSLKYPPGPGITLQTSMGTHYKYTQNNICGGARLVRTSIQQYHLQTHHCAKEASILPVPPGLRELSDTSLPLINPTSKP